MRPEKQYLVNETLARVSSSEYVLLVNFTGVSVEGATELRKALKDIGAEYHIVKNSILNIVAKERSLPDLSEYLAGPTAVVTGGTEVSAVAKVLVKFFETREKASVKVGVIDGEIADAKKIEALSKLPGLNDMRSQLLSLFKEPSAGLVRVIYAFKKDELDALKDS